MDNGRQPATKQDLANLKKELQQGTKQDLAKLQQATKQDLAKVKEELAEAIHDAETRLLKAFYAYAEAAQKHFAGLDHADSSLRDRLGSLETRMIEIEKRLNMPPQT